MNADKDQLESLVMLDALGEATPQQKAHLQEALAKDAELAARHEALTKEVQQVEKDYGTRQGRPLSSEEAAPIPAHVIARLESARREAMANRRGLTAPVSNVISFSSASFKPQATSRRALPNWLAKAAVIALLGVVTSYWFVHEKKLPPIASAALAPRGATGLTQPLIVWENKPDQKYDVWILPPEGSQTEAPALFTAKNVSAPLAFSDLKPTEAAQGQKELQPGKPYRLLVCFASLGRLAGVTVPFETTAEAEGQLHVPADVATMLLKAKRLIEAGKPGDALMVLTKLPEKERNTPQVSALEKEAREKLPAADKVPRG